MQWGARGKRSPNEVVVIGVDYELLKLPMKNKETDPISCSRLLDSRMKTVETSKEAGRLPQT